MCEETGRSDIAARRLEYLWRRIAGRKRGSRGNVSRMRRRHWDPRKEVEVWYDGIH